MSATISLDTVLTRSDILKMDRFTSIILILSFIVCPGSSIVCYDCNSLYDPRCGQQFDPFSLGVVNCSLRDPPEGLQGITPTVCRISKFEVYGKVRIVRGCGYIREEDERDRLCQRKTGSKDIYSTYCACFEDLCNSSPRPAAGLFMIVFCLLWQAELRQ